MGHSYLRQDRVGLFTAFLLIGVVDLPSDAVWGVAGRPQHRPQDWQQGLPGTALGFRQVRPEAFPVPVDRLGLPGPGVPLQQLVREAQVPAGVADDIAPK